MTYIKPFVDKVILKLAKVKGEYSFEHWTALTSKKSKEQKEAKKKDPMGGIMDMMKDMYELTAVMHCTALHCTILYCTVQFHN